MRAIETGRLVLRDWHIDDASDAFQIYGDPEVVGFLGDGFPLRDLDAQREVLAERIERYRRPENAGLGSWAVVEKSSGRVRGALLLKRLPPSTSEIEIGWHFARAVWGNGYATEAGAAALVYGFGDLGLREIHAVVKPDNVASARVALRLRMRLHEERTTRYYDRVELDHYLLSREVGADGLPRGGRDTD